MFCFFLATAFGHLTKMNEFYFEDCLHETVLTDEMVAMIPRETEVLNLSACPRISSITNNVCDGHPNLDSIVMTYVMRITKTTFGVTDCVKYLNINFSQSANSIIEYGASKSFKKLKNLYLWGISKSNLPADILDGRFQVYLDGVLVAPASHDVTTAEGQFLVMRSVDSQHVIFFLLYSGQFRKL